MRLADLAWLATASYAIHILEEHTFDWRNWARAVVKLPVEWSDFYVTNAIVVVLEGLVVSIQTTRLVLFEFFTRFLVAQGRTFRPLPLPPSVVQEH